MHAQETYDVHIWLDDKTLIIQNSELAKGKSKKFLRRLSTESYVNSSNPLVTKWIWYWQHESGIWRMYDKDDMVIKREGGVHIFFGVWIITSPVTARDR